MRGERIWFCKIGGFVDNLPPGSDAPMRVAVEQMFKKVTGANAFYLFSGWGSSLTEIERAVVDGRLPMESKIIEEFFESFEEVLRISDRKHDAWDRAKQALADMREYERSIAARSR